ncbi:MAG TPA: erythromycin esterase family protein [Chloroflexia bacterium]
MEGRFLQYWQEHGGLAQQGFPISTEMQERSETDGKTYTVQYFERAVFELHPETQPPHDVLLSLLGVFEYTRKYGEQGAPDQRANSDSPLLFKETGKTLGGKFRRYWEVHGGLPQQGFPISDEFQERSELDGKTYTVQYFQRAVFELHPESTGTEHEVLLSHLGRFQYDRRYKSGAAVPTATVGTVGVPANATRWLREHAVPLNTTEPNDDFSDLMHLKQFIGSARIVSLGEATHGGREFFTMKHRLLRFLVKEMGFTLFGMEEGWAESLSASDYVEEGKGSAEEAVNNFLAWPWQTQEVIDMLRWMRGYNEGRGSAPEISFQGFDMQEPGGAMSVVIAYLQRVDAPAGERAAARYRCLGSLFDYPSMPQEAKAQCRAGLQQVHDELAAHRGPYEAASSAQAFTQAQFAARIVLQAEELFSKSDNYQVRDRYMAENLAWLLEQRGPDAKAVVWGHNGHVGTAQYAGHEYPSMGMHLRQKYGDAMRVIGFEFNGGSFNATSGRLGVNTVAAAPEGSYGQYFHSADIPLFFLDLRGIRRGSDATDWLVGPRRIWDIGHRFYPADPLLATAEVSLPQTFDGVIFVDMITPTTLRLRR